MKHLIFIPLLLILASCASTDMSEALNSGKGGIPVQQFSDAQTVEQIRALKPQAMPPIKIAVLTTNRWQPLSVDERKAIQKWGDKLKEIGFAKSVEIVPQALMPECHYGYDNECFLKEARISGARLNADAILFINDSTVTDSYVNPSSFLNITIVGMWVVPAHHRDSYSVYEASLFDINNGYLYTIAEGYGEYKMLRPYMYADRTTSEDKARLDALDKLGQQLFDIANEQMQAQ